MTPFELTPELTDQLIHAMEDQHVEYLLDIRERTLKDAAALPDPEAEGLLPIPDWEPSDGFALMTSFIDGLSSPEWQARLRSALTGGRGAFKRFKATLKENRHILAAWRRFKRRRMQREVYDWYNDLRETWGLNRLEPEEAREDLEALLFEDFSLEHKGLGEYADEIRALLAAAHQELHRKLPTPLADALYEEPSWLGSGEDPSRGGTPASGGAPDGLVALDPEEQVAGVIWGERRGAGAVQELHHILVSPVYRGIGLGSLLFDRWVDGAVADTVPYVLVRRCLGHPAIRSMAEGRGFELYDVGYVLGPPANRLVDTSD